MLVSFQLRRESDNEVITGLGDNKMTRPRMLSGAFVKTVKEHGRFGDGRGGFGLSLLVKAASTGRLSKSWSQRLRVGSKAFNRGLGAYPRVTLAQARTAALENVRTMAEEKDPRRDDVPTFADAAEVVLSMHREGWKGNAAAATEAQWRAGLRRYSLPILGNMAIDQITMANVMTVIQPLWIKKPETGRQVRQRISAIMKWSIAQGFRSDNPAGDAIAAALPKVKATARQHRKALPHGEVASTLETLRTAEAWNGMKLAFEFIVLTAARSGEVRGATWDEIAGDVWTIPAERMKSSRPHRVPLSDKALAVLERARTLPQSGNLVFPSMRGKVLTCASISKFLKDNRIPAVPHGFRSSFRDWAAETGKFSHDVCEAALAHTVQNKSEAAYNRTDLFERRRVLMQSWADYLG